jgi:hypothetical protein
MNLRPVAILLILCALPFTASHAQPPPTAQREIDYLLSYVETSGCSFYRNGTWYDGAHAKAHLRSKYDYMVARNLIGSAEDFIDRAAAKSSFSGKPYKIKCGTGPEEDSGPWFHEVLAHLRGS